MQRVLYYDKTQLYVFEERTCIADSTRRHPVEESLVLYFRRKASAGRDKASESELSVERETRGLYFGNDSSVGKNQRAESGSRVPERGVRAGLQLSEH